MVKKSGVIIKPIKYEDVDPHGRAEEHKRGGKKQKSGNRRKNKNWGRMSKRLIQSDKSGLHKQNKRSLGKAVKKDYCFYPFRIYMDPVFPF